MVKQVLEVAAGDGAPDLGSDVTERFLDHYAQYLGEPVKAYPFHISEDLPAIRVLAYDEVILGCRVFASLGLSAFPGEGGEICEIICPVDAGWDDLPTILAQTIVRLVAREPYQPSRGVAIDGIGSGNPKFTKDFDKPALYLTDPYELPEEFAFVGDEESRVYLGIFISQSEYDYLVANGCEGLEDRLEEKSVDPYDIRRKSCV